MKKINPGHVLVAGCCLALMLGVGFGIGITLKATQASRNSAGTYSLATSPVVSSQVITPSLWNNTFNDLAADMTLSLDRNGRGGMLAALRGIDGTLAAPALSFTSETGSGLWRNGAGDVRMSILGALRETWTANGISMAGAPLSAPSAPYLSLMGGAAQFNLYMQDTRGATGNKVGRIIYDGSSLAGGTGNLAKPGWQFQNVDDTGAFVSGGVTIFRDGSLAIGANGTSIGASKVVTVSLTPAGITGPGCNSGVAQGTNVSITNIAFGDVCFMSPPSTLNDGRTWTTCSVSAAGTVTVDICSLINTTPPTGTYTIRTIQAAN